MALILVSNDDGVFAPGIKALQAALSTIADVYVVAPDRERSASGHSLTIHRPLRLRHIEGNTYSLDGTPTDCVAIALEKVVPSKPDLIVSGINMGPNLGDDITYSGTVAAALEGTLYNIPSIAVSLNVRHTQEPLFHVAAEYATLMARFVMETCLPYDTLLNINVPNKPKDQIKGIRFTRQGRRIYEGAINEANSPWENDKYYWIGGGTAYWEHGEDADMHSVVDGYVSITPIHLDLTNYWAMDFLRGRWEPWSTKNKEG